MARFRKLLAQLASSPRTKFVWELLPIMFCDVSSCGNPDPFLLADVFAKVSQRFAPAGFACDPAVQRNVHHLGIISTAI